MTKVYAVAALKINDESLYRTYQAQVPALLSRHGGKVLIADEAPSKREGNFKADKIVVLEFPNEAAAQAYLSDPDYQRIAEIRKTSTIAETWSVKGFVASGS